MAKHKVVSIRDAKSELFGRPAFVTTIGAAVRSFTDEVNTARENNDLYRHPEDFDLYELGEFDDSTGIFNTIVPKLVIQGTMVVNQGEGKISKV